ncbi:LOW QUALITY PROTEIN: hypothetical protein EUGRSUZ_C03793 [Eucalyptus grandis]|uniref:Uncharacterized protein n=1 Tax=Eucalyptus grandis TaxID=71139 RepID=A0ACC3LJR8_EUCGR|nr:LOW QUALITY PROTEIN: hypothetical protein EUGRSUZ_C03793 [Eucalyptus grandis]
MTVNTSTPTMSKKKNRCTLCNKHVGLLGFECGCGDLFCRAHRRTRLRCRFQDGGEAEIVRGESSLQG